MGAPNVKDSLYPDFFTFEIYTDFSLSYTLDQN